MKRRSNIQNRSSSTALMMRIIIIFYDLFSSLCLSLVSGSNTEFVATSSRTSLIVTCRFIAFFTVYAEGLFMYMIKVVISIAPCLTDMRDPPRFTRSTKIYS